MTKLLDKLAPHGYLLAVAAVALSTLLFLPGRDFFARGQWAILYLLVVVLVAGVSGTGPAILASVLAFFAWNFFLLPPYHTLQIHDGKDLVSLFAFLAAGVVMGVQTGRFREREARERELREELARAEAEREADVLKSSLLSSVSHELKTPLAALTATVSNLLESDTTWDERAMRAELEAIVGDITRLNNGVTSLLDLSRLEARAWSPNPDWYDLAEIVDVALDRLPPGARGRVRLLISLDVPALLIDFEQWTRVLQGLIENALLYGGPGEVRVRAACDDAGLWVSVEDDGRGVPAEDRDHVFDKFYRGGQARATVPAGTGLGLAIAREIVLAHDGTIELGSSASGGARFTIRLPAERLETPQEAVT
jgi:two-component system, OmpR family, sensor histidine kinase KdpD